MTTNGILAMIGGGLALLAFVAGPGAGRGSPAAAGPAAGPGSGPGVAELADEFAAGGPVIDAVTLAEWIRDRRAGLRIIDLRDSTDFVQYAVPTAASVPPRALTAELSPESEILLYDDGGGDAARAWLLLRRLGYPRVLVLDGGLLGWVDGVMNPVLPAHTPDLARRFDEVAAISRYFGGMPRVGFRDDADNDPHATREAVQLITRRGCY